MNTGNLQRRWQEEKPALFDKETRIVCLDIKKEVKTIIVDEEVEEEEGYSFIPVEIDTNIDYGHIKSQLIEAGFAQKDEFGLLMNAVDDILKAITGNSTISSIKEALSTEDVNAFYEFCEFRNMCAEAAKEVMKHY